MEPVIAIRELTKTYGTGPTAVHALDGVNLDLATGAFTAVMGASGSGKSTLLNCLAGLDTPTSGSVRLAGHELARLGDDELTRLRRTQIGFVFQSFNLLPTMTAAQNIELPLRLAGTKPDRAWIDHVVGVLGIGERMGHRPSELSGGQQQRVAVARALAARPAVVVADEPTGALDSRSGRDLLDFLRRSVHELGQSVVMVTHDPTAAAYADRAVVLADGRVTDDIVAPTADTVLAALAGAR